MYTVINFKTKKALKLALAAGKKIECFSPGPFPCPTDGTIFLEGPHHPEPHRWYARGIILEGILISVK